MDAAVVIAGRYTEEWRSSAPTATHLPHRVRHPAVQSRPADPREAADDQMEFYRVVRVQHACNLVQDTQLLDS